MLQRYLALLCFDSRIIAFPSVLPLFLVRLCFPTILLTEASPPTLLRPTCSMETAPLYWKIYGRNKRGGGTGCSGGGD